MYNCIKYNGSIPLEHLCPVAKMLME